MGESMNLLIVLVELLLSLLMFILMNYLSDNKISKTDTILVPNIAMILLASIFTKLKDYMILFIIFYLVIDFIYIFIISKREMLINIKNYYINTILTLTLGIIIYQFFLLKVKYTFVDMEVFKNFIWVIIILYFSSKLNIKEIKFAKDEEENSLKYFKEFVIVNYAKLKNKYDYLIKSNSDIEDLLYTFMIYEISNNNKNIISLIKNKINNKNGIMNIESNRKISDEESIVIAKEKLESKYKKIRNSNKIESLIKDNYSNKEYNDLKNIYDIIVNFKTK